MVAYGYLNAVFLGLTKDLPMDLDLEQKPASKRMAGDSDFGFGEMDESRFRDVDAPSPMLG